MIQSFKDVIIRIQFRRTARQRRRAYKNAYTSNHRNESYF
jgi:hypothetical protein